MRALSCWFVEPEVGFEPTTFRLRVETHPSSRCQPRPFWLLASAGWSIQCVPDLPRYGRRNDQENDRPPMLPALSGQLVHRPRRRRGVGRVLAVGAPQGLAGGQQLVRA